MISKLAVRLQALSDTVLLFLAGPKVLFSFSSLLHYFVLGSQSFFQHIIRSSFLCTSEILSIVNSCVSGFESLVEEYSNECALKDSDDASALRWTYRCLRCQR